MPRPVPLAGVRRLPSCRVAPLDVEHEGRDQDAAGRWRRVHSAAERLEVFGNRSACVVGVGASAGHLQEEDAGGTVVRARDKITQ